MSGIAVVGVRCGQEVVEHTALRVGGSGVELSFILSFLSRGGHEKTFIFLEQRAVLTCFASAAAILTHCSVESFCAL